MKTNSTFRLRKCTFGDNEKNKNVTFKATEIYDKIESLSLRAGSLDSVDRH